MIGVDGPGAVKLLNQHHAYHGMGQCQVRQANAFVSRFFKSGVQPIRPTNDQSHIITLQLPMLKFLGQCHGGEIGAALIECDDTAAFGYDGLNPGALSRVEGFKRLGRAWLSFNGFELYLELIRETLGIRTTAFLAGAFLAAAGFLAANLTGSLMVTRLTAIF